MALLMSFIAYVCFSAVITGYDFNIITPVLMLLSALIFSSIYDRREDYIGLLNAIIIADVIMIVLLVLLAGSVSSFLSIVSDDELSTLFIQKNIIAFSMSIGIIVSLYLVLFQKHWFFFITLVLFVLVLFCTGSRRGLLTMFLGLGGLYYFNSKVNNGNILKLVIGVTVSIFVFMSLLQLDIFSNMNERLTSLILGLGNKNELSSSDEYRFILINKAFEMFKENPVLGHGAGAFKAKAGFGIYSHNNYVELLANYGLVGFCLFYGYIIKILKLSYLSIGRYKDAFSVFLFILLCIRLVSDFGNVSYYDKFIYIIFGVAISYFKFIKLNEKRTI